MKIKEIKINSFEQYVDKVGVYFNDTRHRLYRGQKDDLPLHSKLYRLVKQNKAIKDFYKIEKKVLEDFKRLYIIYKKEIDYQNPWDLLSLSQHFGLPTRLLDWTSNPMIALWFAFAEEKGNDNDRVVWGLVVEDDILADTENEDPFDQRFIKAFKPKNIDNRIIAQHSWFTIQNPNIKGKSADGLPYINSPESINESEEFDYSLARFLFPNEKRNEILRKLDIIGINHASVFPDLSGLCNYIEWKELK